jgi:pentose-5-phosphate-3-epimerase
MLRVLGATKTNKNKNFYQEALLLYPELLNDGYSKKIIKDKKKSLVKEAVSGKIKINGKYTFLVPDLYAFCERLFLNSDNPQGLLKNGDVYCNIFNEGKVDILRSPHLYKEHCVRNNSFNGERKEWFITNGIYTSIFDPISKILQFDNDGDKGLVVQDELFIKIAERNMEGVLPLYYEMGFAKAEPVTNKKIYDSLLLAFKANIGEVSNNITKVFNSDNIDIRVVKWLTAENNYIIDFAKSLYMPIRPEWVDKIIKSYIKSKVPYFFIEAKDKEKNLVEPINNSTVNKLRKIIPNKPINFEKIAGKLDYHLLMSKNIKYTNKKIIDTYRKLDRSKKWLIRNSGLQSKNEGIPYVYKYIKEQLKIIEPDEDKIVNVLVEELYGRANSSIKTTLWNCFGDILLRNLKLNLKGTKQCESCGDRIEIVNNQSKYCDECSNTIKKEKTRNRVRKYREKCNALEIS